MIALALLALTGYTVAGGSGFLAADLVAAAGDLPAVRVVAAQTVHWAAAFDPRLLGCPTIVIQEH